MIDFGQPWMLLGLLLAAVPVIVHLWGRRKAPTVPFAALAFVLQSNPHRARALRLTEWLLVALRSLAVALIALALARPMVPVPGPVAVGLDGLGGPVAMVVVLDDSMSMGARGDDQTLFELARARTLALIERLPTGSKVAVITSGFPARLLQRQMGSDRGAVLDAVRRVEHRPRKDDAAHALQLADALLAATEMTDRRVVVLTDLQASGWQGLVPPWQGRVDAERKPPVVRVDRLKVARTDNTAIVDAVATPAPDRGPGQVRVEVTLRHTGQRPFRDYLTVQAGDREARSLVEMAPGETVKRALVLPEGAPVAEVRLPPDTLLADNQRLVRLDGAATVRVALLDGAPRPVPREDEVFFAARALEMAGERPGEIDVDVLQLPGMSVQTLANYDVIVLANVGELPNELIQGLAAAAEAGKGVLIAVGDNLPADLTAYLPGLLPAPLSGQRQVGQAANPRAVETLRAELPSADAPLPAVVLHLREALEPLQESLGRAQVSRMALVQPSAATAQQVVLRYQSGAPALVVAPRGRGAVGIWTTTLDRDWNDLPLQPVWLPMLRSMVLGLAGDRSLEGRHALELGEVAVLAREDRAEQLELQVEPPAQAARIVVEASTQRGRSWQVAKLDQVGRWTATELRSGAALSSRSLIVVPPASESDLTIASAGPLTTQSGQRKSASGHGARAPGQSMVLLVLFGLLVLEGLLLARGHWRRQGSAG